MKHFKALLAWSLIGLYYCQQGGIEIIEDNDLEDFSNSTKTEISSSLNDEDNSTISVTYNTITTTTSDDSNTTTTEDDNSSTFTTTSTNFPIIKDSNFSACEMNPCKNGGQCEDLLDSSVYSCLCPSGYTGTRCAIKDNCLVVENDICKKGYCSYSEDRLMRECKCFVGMFWNDLKEECENEQPPCFPNPCRNGGVCNIEQNSDYKCNCPDGYEGPTCSIENKCGVGNACFGGRCEVSDDLKICTCVDGKYWNEYTSQCEEMKPPCTPNPCKNEGLCVPLSNGGYNCTCAGHYLDQNCNKENICYNKDNIDAAMCGNEGVCQVLENSSTCLCNEGYFFDTEMRTCREKILPCYPNPCSNDGLCTPVGDINFNCTCSDEYVGELCKVPDFCVLQGGNTICGNASCESYSDLNVFRCRCDEGSYFDYQIRTCLEIDFCPVMTCESNEQCVKSECVCQDNFIKNNETKKCKANFCASNPCPVDDMMCTEGEGVSDYYCSCKEGYSFNGIRCEEAACEFPPFHKCDQGCVPSDGDFACSCNEHFILQENNRTCKYTGNTTCTNKTCDKGTCFKDDNGEELCICPTGFKEDAGKCIDLCKLMKLPDGICPDNQCESTNEGFRCKCEGKYELSKDKVTCTNRRICQNGEKGWIDCAAKYATCIEDWNSDLGYACQCTFPQKESNNGICQDICSNEEYQRNCSALGAKCDINAIGEVICKCPPLYKPLKNGVYCNQHADVSYLITIPLDLDTYTVSHTRQMRRKRSLDTEYSADYFQIQYDAEKALSTIFPELTQINVIDCKQNSNYYLCKMELQFISITEEDLKRIKLPDLCQSSADSNKCLIPPSLISRKKQLNSDLTYKKSDPCDADVKDHICGSETICTSSENSFNCTCDIGYEKRDKIFPFADSSSFIEICKDINECLIDGICPEHTMCENLMGSYSCSCVKGHIIKDKSSDPKVDGCVEICNPNPCDHGSCEKVGGADFACKCEAGFTGVLCDLTDSNFKRQQTNTIIVGAVLGGVLLITLIIFFVTVQRLKKKKYDDPDQMLYATEMNDRRGGAVNNAYQ